ALDGSEDHLIHCIKPDGPIPSGRAALEESRIRDGAALEEALSWTMKMPSSWTFPTPDIG
ncbi:hypothetical protein AAVH_39717, partial [Aphelenchoides avenae]